ncbi:MAG: hypothetical protein COA78_09840 [Blastopirellula sp.]|nr:MAG: hypothetical protein COA78_09840 [Blastopirellula sp.]
MNQYQNSAGSPKETNTMGLVGFIFSLVGFISCGLLSPIALLVSLIGLLKAPRGFAIAGSAISLLGTIFLGTIGYGLVMTYLFVSAGVNATLQVGSIENARQEIRTYIEENDSLPASDVGQALLDKTRTSVRYKLTNDDPENGTATMTYHGADWQFDTEDDYTEEFTKEEFLFRSSLEDEFDLEFDPPTIDIEFNETEIDSHEETTSPDQEEVISPDQEDESPKEEE